MPELPELQAHAERLTDDFGGGALAKFAPCRSPRLKTATPPRPRRRSTIPCSDVGRRGKYLLLDFERGAPSWCTSCRADG